MESYTPRLFWGWSVLASFNSDFHLVWRLQPEGAHYWYCRYFRRTLTTDFRTLTRLLKERAGDTGIKRMMRRLLSTSLVILGLMSASVQAEDNKMCDGNFFNVD